MLDKIKSKIVKMFKSGFCIRRVICCYFALQRKYDWIIYPLAMKSLNRICKRNIGLAYLMELSFRDFVERNNISDELRKSTESFYNELWR